MFAIGALAWAAVVVFDDTDYQQHAQVMASLFIVGYGLLEVLNERLPKGRE
jgi:hypothetical protein